MMTGDPVKVLRMQADLDAAYARIAELEAEVKKRVEAADAVLALILPDWEDLKARLEVNREALAICQTRRREETEALQARIAELEAKDEPNSKDAGGAAETGV